LRTKLKESRLTLSIRCITPFFAAISPKVIIPPATLVVWIKRENDKQNLIAKFKDRQNCTGTNGKHKMFRPHINGCVNRKCSFQKGNQSWGWGGRNIV